MTADQMLEHEWIVNPTTSNIIDMDFPGSLSVHKSDQDLLYTINKYCLLLRVFALHLALC